MNEILITIFALISSWLVVKAVFPNKNKVEFKEYPSHTGKNL